MPEYKLIQGNNIDVIRGLKENTVDVIVTSPPYNLDMPYGEHKDNMPYNVYLDTMAETFIECKRILKDNGHLFLNIAGSSTQPWVGFDLAQRLRDEYVLQNNICWVKSFEDTTKGCIRGHNKPVNSKRYLSRTWEFILHFTKNGSSAFDHEKGGVLYAEQWREVNKKRTGRDWRPTNNTWFIPYETIGSYGGKDAKKKIRGEHPAVFPKVLVKKCCNLAGNTGILLDPFVGSGTSIIAALECGMDAIGIDIDENYLTYAKNRIDREIPSEVLGK